MSLAAIQDSLVKTSLVQHTQARGDDIGRGQENAIVAQQQEDNRQEDQVVLRSREAEQNGVRPDEEKEQGQGREREEEEEEQQNGEAQAEDEEDNGPRAKMRRINIVV